MSMVRLSLVTALAMAAFAGNSLLCRLALATASIDAASFTSIRLASGALLLLLMVWLKHGSLEIAGNWLSALALFCYAAGFSFAYVNLPAGTGALLLFGAVQATMIGYGVSRGERLNLGQGLGLVLALTGFVGLVLPGISAPPPAGAALMLGSGVAWGIYSLRGRGSDDPARQTAGNFLRSVPLAALLSMVMYSTGRVELDVAGTIYGLASGAITSALGYVLWYSALPLLRAATAATVQLSVPVIAALGGVLFLQEAITVRLLLASSAVLGGIAVFISCRKMIEAANQEV